jgi:UDP-N-acetylmuramate--alanine ligase
MKIHFIGIGGIGVSALARYYLEKGHEISGSDLVSSEITDALKNKGAKIFIGKHKAENVPKNVDLVIYSPAVQKTNPEFGHAMSKQLKAVYTRQATSDKPQTMSYPQVLGELTKKYFTIAISGTHGKSTATAMVALILIKAGFDPTVIVGTKVKEFKDSNCRVGKSQYLVIEADEHFASFLNYWPKIIVLTALEADHLDYYKNFKNYILAFKKFISHLPKDGILIANKDDKNIQKLLKPKKKAFSTIVANTIYFSLRQKETEKFKKILKIPGEHNISNALATLAVARILKIPDKISFKALSEFRGSWRRFEIIEADLRGSKRGKTRKLTLINDYGHHPTQIRVTLRAAREKYPKKKIWVVFQPHQYQRTYYLFNDFVKVFKKAPVDKIIITDIFDVAGREEKEIKKKVSSEKLVKAINRKETIYISSIEKAANYLKKNLQGKEVVIIMGAGNVYKLVDLLSVK